MPNKSQSKRDQFTKPQKSKLPLMVGIITITLVAVVLFVWFGSGGQDDGDYFGDPVVSSRSYIGEFISMTAVNPVIEDGQVKIPLEAVDENNIVYFELENNLGQLVPLMAYITPTGRIFAGSSMCEPCRGQTFSLAGETLVCDTCRTTYNIESHEFISGARACGSLPPVDMYPTIQDGMVIIDIEEVLNWRIRA